MNKELVKKSKQLSVFSGFILGIETLQIVVFVTFIATVLFLIFGGMLFTLSAHAESGQITIGLSIGQFFLKVFIFEAIITAVLFLMKLPLIIIDIIDGILDEWEEVKHKYNTTFNRDKD